MSSIGVEDARSEVKLGIALGLQGASAMATALTMSSREAREFAESLERRRQHAELHTLRVAKEEQSTDQQREKHQLDVETKKQILTNKRDEATRNLQLDSFRAIEIGARIHNNGRLNDAKIDEVREKIKRSDKDLKRRNRESRTKGRREKKQHRQNMANARARGQFARGKYTVDVAEALQRMQDRVRRMGLAETLGTTNSTVTAAMRTAAAYAAAQGTSNWGDKESQQVADFAEMAMQDGVDLQTLIDHVRAQTPTGTPGSHAPLPEEELATTLVKHAHDERTQPPADPEAPPASAETIDAAGLNNATTTEASQDSAPAAYPEASGADVDAGP